MVKIKEAKKVIYPQLKFSDPPCTITPALAKELLGWEETDEKDYSIVDKLKNKVLLRNNVHNRPLYLSQVETYTQEILNRRWEFNGEPIIIGNTGTVLNGQHTLISLVFADQLLASEEANEDQVKAWKGKQIEIHKLIVYGVLEKDTIINTMDTCKPRSLSDVIYRSDYFKKLKSEGERKLASRITDYAVRYLWYRTGYGVDAFAIRRTHAEAIDFLEHHKELLKAVWFVMTEDGKKKNISKMVPLGYAAALLYLMAAADSDQVVYQNKRSEGEINFEKWDKAQQYFMFLNSGKFPEVIQAIAGLRSLNGEGGGTIKEKVAILILGWQNFLAKKDIPIELIYEEDEDGKKHLAEFPVCGGIDMGEIDQIKKDKDDEDEDEEEPEEIKEPEEVQKKKEKLKKIKEVVEKLKEKKEKQKKEKAKKKETNLKKTLDKMAEDGEIIPEGEGEELEE